MDDHFILLKTMRLDSFLCSALALIATGLEKVCDLWKID